MLADGLTNKMNWLAALLLAASLFIFVSPGSLLAQSQNPQRGSIGLEGVIPGEAPTTPPTITTPGNGQSFSNLPVTVRGICQAGLEVRIFRNDVFAGSVVCSNSGTYELQLDLFTGRNEIIARAYDQLGQFSPDSNRVAVTYNPPRSNDGFDQLVITSNYSSRGANPGSTLIWPLAIAGGQGPYAISVDWGDGTILPISLSLSGEFDIDHVYAEPGVYKVIVRATDSRGEIAFIQLIAIANGPLPGVGQEDPSETPGVEIRTVNKYVLWPVYLMLFFVLSTFWIGRRYERRRIKEKLYNREGIKF